MTVTSTRPAELTCGLVPVQVVAVQVKAPAGVPPKSTVPPDKPVPLIVTAAPPIVQPDDGDTFLITGSTNVNLDARVAGVRPPGVRTLTFTVPGFAPIG